MAVADIGLQGTLFGGCEPAVAGPIAAERVDLAHGAWIVRVQGWMRGDQTLLEHVRDTTDWHEWSRPMYDRVVEVPRLTAQLPRDGEGHPVLASARGALDARFGQRFSRIGLALYRDGKDSVAPHGDMVAREMDESVMAIVSCGARRRFLLKPADGGGATVSFDFGEGDLLVMGGTIQRTWRHSVPKTSKPVGPRLSIMFRPHWKK